MRPTLLLWPAALWLPTSLASAQSLPPNVRTVRADAPSGGNGLTWATAFNDLQLALNAAGSSGGQITEVWLATGTYRPPPSTTCTGFLATNVSIYGGFAGTESSPEHRPPIGRSTLSGDQMQPVNGYQCGFVLSVSGSSPVFIDRLELVGAGRASGLKLNSGAELRNTDIRANGGFNTRCIEKLVGGPLTLNACDFESYSSVNGEVQITGICNMIDSRIQHSGTLGGDGIIADEINAVRSVIDGRGDEQGGLVVERLNADLCTLSGSGGYVRAVHIESGTITRSTLNSYADFGMLLGTVHFTNSTVISTAKYNVLSSNGTSYDGCMLRLTTNDSPPVATGSQATFTNCTFRDPNGRLQFTANWRMDNCIIWRTSGPPAQGFLSFPTGVTGLVNHSCIQGWDGSLGGVGNISADPLLNPDGSLGPSSPCVDAGSNAAAPPGLFHDLRSNCRIVDGDRNGSATIDMGAIEAGQCHPNCDCSTASPILSVADFACFLDRFASGDIYANCDQSTTPPTLNVADFTCFLQRFAASCP